jgi:multidrug efflux pump
MTTAATVFGHLPLIFAHGPGAGARNSIGIALVTGMIIGTSFTLFVVPAIYTLVAKVHKREEVEALTPESAGTLVGHGAEVAPV